MGHATIGITLDRYGHLMPGNEDEAAGMLDADLARAATVARLAQSRRRRGEARANLGRCVLIWSEFIGSHRSKSQ